jgi:hypothetical protein
MRCIRKNLPPKHNSVQALAYYNYITGVQSSEKEIYCQQGIRQYFESIERYYYMSFVPSGR